MRREYIAHVIGYVFELYFVFMSVYGDFSKKVDEADGQIEIFDVLVWNNTQEESNELKKVESFFEVFGEELYDLYLMFLNVGHDGFGIVLFDKKVAVFVF